MTKLMRVILLFALALILSETGLVPSSVQAQEKEAAQSFLYSPEGCEFKAVFPKEPYRTQRCRNVNADSCQNVTSYTEVFDAQTSLNINLTCNPIPADSFSHYNNMVMETALAAMVIDKQLSDYQSAHQDGDAFKHAVIMGAGQKGLSEALFVGQLWIGHNSLMTVEAELIGAQGAQYQDQFAEIIRTIGPLEPQASENQAEKKEDTPEAE